MATGHKVWNIARPAPAEHLRRYKGMSPVLAQVLYNRGLEDPTDALRFLISETDLFNPMSLKGMNEAVRRIRFAIKGREKIIVYGDFDADGVTATALLTQALRALGANVEPYIPHRIDEGYGLNTEALVRLRHTRGARLVITVDCGIRSVQEVEDGKRAGLDMIVTDHHSVGDVIPAALAVINPKQHDCKYPEKMLAGVGLAYKLADALFRASKALDKPAQQPRIPLEHLLDLVAIGTVADLAPMDRLENRVLVRRGLDVINSRVRPGIVALIEAAAVKNEVDSEAIGFALGPRINAAGRLGSATAALDLLMAEDLGQARRLAEQLNDMNRQRQELTRQAQDRVRERLIASGEQDSLLIFAQDPGFQEGIVGLVAGRLTEEFYRPSVVMHQGAEESRASCRSIPQFDITRALDQCADLLVRHGGHAQAAGLTVRNENIPLLRRQLAEIAEAQLAGQELVPRLDIDAELPFELLDMPLADELEQLQPTGYHNKPPLFVTRQLKVVECRTVGKTQDHLKLRLVRPGQVPVDAIGFGLGSMANALEEYVDVAFALDINEYNGKRTPQLMLEDVRASGLAVL